MAAAPGDAGASASGRAAQAKGKAKQDQYVELSRERTDKVFVFLVEFGDERHANYPDVDTDPATPGPVTWDGPMHNEIPQLGPNDNSTQWQADDNREYFQNLYFGTREGVESLKSYYEQQSSGRYSVDGTVNDWVKVPFNQARYGRSNGSPCGDIVCSNTWALIRDGVTQWAANQKAAGKTDAEIAAAVAEYDVLDRYDFDGDGDFNESDGYIDRFQIVHAGGDQADGDPIYGEDAIWSHSWYAYGSDIGATGPEGNRLGGTQIGSTGIWAGDYTIQPENGGLSVVAHEYGHDLGLPDHCDTGASGDNAVSWWTLMAQSRVSAQGDQGIGTRAADLSAWDKLQLGWLDYEAVVPGQKRTLELGPHEDNSAKAQGAVVVLPKKEVTAELGASAAGTKQFYSAAGNDLESTMATTLDLTGASTAEMTFQARFDIESGYDYVYAQASLDGGTTWVNLDGTVDGRPFVRDASLNPAISGVQAGWADVVVPMDAAAGQGVSFRFLYRTDGGVTGIDDNVVDGFLADEIVITKDDAQVLVDGAETDGEAWTFGGGFGVVESSVTTEHDHYYIASNREYVAYDLYLKTGPYNFGFPSSKPDFVEHFPYQDGLLVSYWDTSYTDNNTREHPGSGLVLPIDAHPRTIFNLDGTAWRGRIQTYDAPFGLEKADSFTLTNPATGNASYIRGQAGNPLFDDSDPDRYFAPDHTLNKRVGVKVAGSGTKIRVLKEKGTSVTIGIDTTAVTP